MTPRALVVRGLEERYLTLSRPQSDLLLRRYGRQVQLRPAAGGHNQWLLRARDCCGVIALPGGLALHIEPKATIANLWRLLAGAHDLMELGPRLVRLQTAADVLQSLAEIFVARCERIVQAGLLHGYRPREEDMRTLRGALDLSRNLRLQSRARHLLACRYDEYTAEVLENRLLRWTLHRLGRMRPIFDHVLCVRAQRCAAHMSCVPLTAITDYDFASVRFDRLNRHYRTPLALARLLLSSLGVTHRPGDFALPGMLVDMPEVFEGFVARLLQRSLPTCGPSLRTQTQSTVLDDQGRIALLPDVVITCEGSPVCVVDAKYKLTGPGSRACPPSAEDVYQVLTYCVGYQVRHALLVYPEALVGSGPLTVTRCGLQVRILPFGLDLSTDADGFSRACRSLVSTVGELARSGLVPAAGR